MVANEQIRDAWDQIADGFDENVTPANFELGSEALRRAGLGAGMEFLDVAAGSGALSIPAARLGARVLATDMSPAMIDLLASRARAEGLSNLEGRVMDGQALDLDDNTFDIVGSQLGVMVFPDMPRGIREMVRVTRPGGRVLVVAFAEPARVEFISSFVRAVRTAVPDFAGPTLDPPPLPFQLSDPERLREEYAGAGLVDIQVETVDVSMVIESAEQWWKVLTNSNPIGRQIVAGLTDDKKSAVRRELDALLQERSAGSGPARLSNVVNIGTGTKP